MKNGIYIVIRSGGNDTAIRRPWERLGGKIMNLLVKLFDFVLNYWVVFTKDGRLCVENIGFCTKDVRFCIENVGLYRCLQR